MKSFRFEKLEQLLAECESSQEEELVLKGAIIFCKDQDERSKLELWLMHAQNPPKNPNKRQPGNPNFNKEYTIESEIEKYKILEKAYDLLQGDYEEYKPKRKGAVVSNNLKLEIAAQLNISGSKVYRILEEFSSSLIHFYREREETQ